MRLLRDLEGLLIRAESGLAVVLVLTMLTLAGYNVLYRNVLVRVQQHYAHSGPPVDRSTGTTPPTAVPTAEAPAKAEDGAEVKAPAKGGADDFGGFGGGFGGDDADDDDDGAEAVEPAAGDDFGGFGGGFGEDDEDDDETKVAAPAKAEPPPAAGDDFGGFGGGFREEDDDEPEAAPAEGGAEGFGGFGGGLPKAGDEPKAADEEDEEDEEDDLGDDDQFANLPSIDAVATQPIDLDQGGPPPAGSFAAWTVDFIDTIKLDWIDVLLRQLVIIVAFLGAALATQRGKHINIDALSKVMPRSVQRVIPVVMNLLSLGVCLLLASAGWDLVKISIEYPKDLLPWAEEWQFQLMFPVGFGLLALHFGVRLVESAIEPKVAEASAPVASNPDVPDAPDVPDQPDDFYDDELPTEVNPVAAAAVAAADAVARPSRPNAKARVGDQRGEVADEAEPPPAEPKEGGAAATPIPSGDDPPPEEPEDDGASADADADEGGPRQ